MNSYPLIGIGGTNGAGKDTVGEILADKHGWKFISVTDILRNELAREGLPTDRHHTHQLSARWRRESGMAVLIDKAVQAYEAEKSKYKGLAIASLRHPAEADEVHKLGGKVIWIDADPKVRYGRVVKSGRGRVDDQKTFEEFMAEEAHQMHQSGDEATLNMAGVKQKADLFIINETTETDLLNEIQKMVF
jgi:dephospho-CoA kinase